MRLQRLVRVGELTPRPRYPGGSAVSAVGGSMGHQLGETPDSPRGRLPSGALVVGVARSPGAGCKWLADTPTRGDDPRSRAVARRPTTPDPPEGNRRDRHRSQVVRVRARA